MALDCRDAERLSSFWCAVFGTTVVDRRHDAVGKEYVEIGLAGLGATVLTDDPEQPRVVLTDPEGNEFCVVPPRDGPALRP